jgi:pimeloyl-ACP methyl ester carboxylesterase
MHALVLAMGLWSVSPCRYGGLAARCGVMTVAENRNVAHGRTIDVHFVVLPARKKPVREPIFFIAGGPGQAIIALIEPGAKQFARPYLDRDIVLEDQRGTGTSHPLACNIAPTEAVVDRWLFAPDVVRACRTRLAREADLNAYGTDVAADDVNLTRRRLGYGKIVLWGGSYGTDLALVYLRRHPDSVAAAILEGVAPPWLLLPLPFPRGAQAALEDLERSCAADQACSRDFPRFPQEFGALIARAKSGIPVSGGRIAFEVLVDRLRQAMYDSYTASYVPLIVHRWSGGEGAPLAKLVSTLSHTIPGLLAMGMNLSVTCSESLAFITPADAVRASAGTFMGDARYRAQRAACKIWNVAPVARSFLAPIRSDVPVLMLGGAADPATPPRFGAQEVAYLPNGRQILVPHAGHDFGSPCVDRIEAAFLVAYHAKTLDTRCLVSAHRPPFATTLKGLF